MWFQVDEKALDDDKIADLANRLGLLYEVAFFRCCRVWKALYKCGGETMTPESVDAAARTPGFSEAMLDVDLAEAVVGGLRIKGSERARQYARTSDDQRHRAVEGWKKRRERMPGQSPGNARAKPRQCPGMIDVVLNTEDMPGHCPGNAVGIAVGNADLSDSDCYSTSGSGSGSASSEQNSETVGRSSARAGAALALPGMGAPPPRRKARAEKSGPLAKWRAVAERLWALQEQLRRQALPGSRGLEATAERLERIAERLEAGATEADCEHVLRVYASEADPAWFNGETNWRPRNFDRALGRVLGARASPARDVRVGHVQVTGGETYRDGEVEDF